MISDREQRVENTVMYRQPVKLFGNGQCVENWVMHRQPVTLSENGGDVITPFSVPYHDPGSCV